MPCARRRSSPWDTDAYPKGGNRMKKKYGILASLLLIAALLGGCGGSKDASYQETSAPAEEPMASSSYSMDSSAEYAPEMEAAAEEAGGVTSTSGIENVNTVSQKLIKTVSMSMETKEFDALLEDIRRQVEEMGGYIEDSDISGSSYYSTRGNRNAWLTLRIPAGKLEGFVTVVEELGNVVSKIESVEDITLRYVDVESHKKALETEQERLLELLERAENMEDIITIESRLSQVRYELQSYESALRTYDNQVNYSTVSLDISEVERVAELPEEKTFLEEVRYRLSDNLYDLGRDFRGFGIWFLSSLPYLLLWAAVIAVFIRLIRKIVWKKPFFGIGKRRRKEELPVEDSEEKKEQ